MVGKPRNQVQQLNVWGAGSPGVLGEGCGQCSSCPGATWLLCSGGHLRPGGSEVGPGVGDDSLAPGPHAPHPVRVQEPGLGSDHSGSPEGPGLCSQPGSVCCARLAGPCGQRRGAEPRTTHALSWGCSRSGPGGNATETAGGPALCAHLAVRSSCPWMAQPPRKSWDSGPSLQQLPLPTGQHVQAWETPCLGTWPRPSWM